jgi:hypothetical protein
LSSYSFYAERTILLALILPVQPLYDNIETSRDIGIVCDGGSNSQSGEEGRRDGVKIGRHAIYFSASEKKTSASEMKP